MSPGSMWQRIITPRVTLSGQNQIMVKNLGPEAPSRIRVSSGKRGARLCKQCHVAQRMRIQVPE